MPQLTLDFKRRALMSQPTIGPFDVFAEPGWIAVGFATSALKSNNARRIRVWSRGER